MEDPRYAAEMNKRIDQALGGSNVILSHTDQGSAGDPNFEAGGIGVNINRERFNDWGFRGSRAWREQRQRDIAMATRQEPDKAVQPPTRDFTGKPIQFADVDIGGRSVLDRTMGREITQRVEGTGKIEVDVKAAAPKGSARRGLFKNVEQKRQTQMERAESGPETRSSSGGGDGEPINI
jgi:hypothetical protein